MNVHKLICDFCEKDIRRSDPHVKVTIETESPPFGSLWEEQELHLHIECATRLRNKINQFIEEKRKELKT